MDRRGLVMLAFEAVMAMKVGGLLALRKMSYRPIFGWLLEGCVTYMYRGMNKLEIL